MEQAHPCSFEHPRFQLASNVDPAGVAYLNYRIMQSDGNITMDQSHQIIKICNNCFKDRTPLKCGLMFRTDPRIVDDHETAVPCFLDDLKKRVRQCSASF